MKDWLRIGQFSREVKLSARALRVYEEVGLLAAHSRGENQYRYYLRSQIELVERIKKFKSLGFSLNEIRSLLEVDSAIDSEKLGLLLCKRRDALKSLQSLTDERLNQIENILSSLSRNENAFGPKERKFIMTQFEKLSVIVSGVRDLKETADFIRDHFSASGKEIPVQVWDGESKLPTKKPFVLVIPEHLLGRVEPSKLSADVVVIKELSGFSNEIHDAYMRLYGTAGPHMSTILNADDRAVVELAASEIVRKGKTYYFSKNSGLRTQISKIGGVVSDGETVEVFGLNQTAKPFEIKLKKIFGIGHEMAFLASVAAVMDFGLHEGSFQ